MPNGWRINRSASAASSRRATDSALPEGSTARQFPASCSASTSSGRTRRNGRSCDRSTPTVTSKWTWIVTVKTKPISKEPVPCACHGVGPSSVASIRTEKRAWEPLRTASFAVKSATKWKGLLWIRTSKLMNP